MRNQSIQIILAAILFVGSAYFIYLYFNNKKSSYPEVRIGIEMKAKFKDLSNLLSETKIVPKFNSNNEVECLEIAQVKKGGVFSELLLQEKDCAREVRIYSRGISSPKEVILNNPAAAMSIYSELNGADRVEIILLRNNVITEIHYIP